MIFKKLARGIAHRDWFTVGLEILVVAIGLLLGLQVDGWNTARLERQEERAYLQRIQAELTDYIGNFDAVRQRRGQLSHSLNSFSDALYGRAVRDELTPEECSAITSSHILSAYNTELPVLSELATSGRMHLLRNEALRAAIVATRQARERVAELVEASSVHSFNLRSRYPELIQVESYFDEADQSVHVSPTCDLQGMRTNQAFKNEASTNLDLYDAFFNFRLHEYGNQLSMLQAMVNAELSEK